MLVALLNNGCILVLGHGTAAESSKSFSHPGIHATRHSLPEMLPNSQLIPSSCTCSTLRATTTLKTAHPTPTVTR
ncbi:hypothetical protein EV361DRAFT_943279 [Lentinula raphanica]|uniref:Secreted protein n=1 Tax=Lentinula raphanica TaxID=153919 RepID=A0AA38P0N5_9AGAR|nr:hypothetical protein F5878DRAFT_373770 [Lentinula raphanica]KAJ3963810.1 hypothetical protein EV361DRAFT_943279 [Lentinula raphanica]